MIDRPVTLPPPLNMLVSKSLSLCELMLPVCDIFYPFAAIYENGRVGCIFTEEAQGKKQESQLIEQLQWRIIDMTTDTNFYSVLVYAATVNTQESKTLNAIAVATASPSHDESLILYPYYKVKGQIVISPPINTVTR